VVVHETVLTIGERIRDDGSLEQVTLEARDGALWIRVGEEPPAALPSGALEGVMRRYGKPLAPDVAVDGPRLDLGEECALVRIRHLARYDVIAKDFLVLSAPGREPLVELAVAVAGALVYLARGCSRL
jgi:hypothetical protein